MMIIKPKNFSRSKIRANWLSFILLLQLTGCAQAETFETETFRTTSGWGYCITYKNKIIIKQAVIPVINESKSFSTEEDARKMAHLVAKKLHQMGSPTVTENDLILLKIKF